MLTSSVSTPQGKRCICKVSYDESFRSNWIDSWAVARVFVKERVATTPLSRRSTPRGGCSSILPTAVAEQSVQSGVMHKLNFDHFLVTQHQNIALFLLLHCTNHNYCLPCPLILGHPSIYYSSDHPPLSGVELLNGHYSNVLDP